MAGELIRIGEIAATGIFGGVGLSVAAWFGLRGKRADVKQTRENSEAERLSKFNEKLMDERTKWESSVEKLQTQVDALRDELDVLRRAMLEKDAQIAQLMGENRQLKQVAESNAFGARGQAAGVAAGLRDALPPG